MDAVGILQKVRRQLSCLLILLLGEIIHSLEEFVAVGVHNLHAETVGDVL